jgi:GT2 family glycosyltransferase
MESNHRLTIIIPVHNRKEYTSQCLSSLRKQTFKEYSIIVIDDGSTDGTKEMLALEYPEVRVLTGDGNLWWTRATNYGVKFALKNRADYILTLNNDTIAKEDFLEKMIYWAEQIPHALLGACAFDAVTKEPLYGGERINWLTAGYTKLLDIIVMENWKGLHEVTHFPGRGLLIPAEVFRKIGMFEERIFPQSAADEDFTMKAIRAGYPVYCNFDAKIGIYPKESGDSALRDAKSIANYWRHLFSLKGGGNILRFVRYAIRNAPNKYLVPFMISGLTRRILGYPIEWFKEILQSKSDKKNIS